MFTISALITLLRPSFTVKLKVWRGMNRGTMSTEICRFSTVVNPLLTSTVKASRPCNRWMYKKVIDMLKINLRHIRDWTVFLSGFVLCVNITGHQLPCLIYYS